MMANIIVSKDGEPLRIPFCKEEEREANGEWTMVGMNTGRQYARFTVGPILAEVRGPEGYKVLPWLAEQIRASWTRWDHDCFFADEHDMIECSLQEAAELLKFAAEMTVGVTYRFTGDYYNPFEPH